MKISKLTARQLMIGDWVMSTLGSNQPVKVYAIGNNFIDLRYGKIKQSGILALCDFEPIPLTEEILKANADGGSCSFDEFRSLYHLKNNGYHREISISFDKTWHVPFVEIMGMGHATIKINMQYVHELQHALRLCGLNGLADNFVVPNTK